MVDLCSSPKLHNSLNSSDEEMERIKWSIFVHLPNYTILCKKNQKRNLNNHKITQFQNKLTRKNHQRNQYNINEIISSEKLGERLMRES